MIEVIAFSGHVESDGKRWIMKRTALEIMDELRSNGKICSVGGNPRGWDREVMEAAYKLGVPLRLHLPFPGINCPQKFIKYALQTTGIVTYESKVYAVWHYLNRNQKVIEGVLKLYVWYDGREKGGTIDTINKAKTEGIPIYNVYPDKKGWLNK